MKICGNSTITRLSLGAAFVLGTAISANAATFQAFTVGSRDVDPGNFTPPEDINFTTGMQMTTSQSLTLTALGAYRAGLDNEPTNPNPTNPTLATTRTVTLWSTITQLPIISATLSEGGANTFLSADGKFIYQNLLASLTLPAGTYRLSTFINNTPGDNDLFVQNQVTFTQPLLVNANPIPNGVQLNGNGYPSDLFGGFYNVSANMILDDGTGGGTDPTTPEPSLVGGLILLGLGGLFQKIKR